VIVNARSGFPLPGTRKHGGANSQAYGSEYQSTNRSRSRAFSEAVKLALLCGFSK
jgi:hypothetical protein